MAKVTNHETKLELLFRVDDGKPRELGTVVLDIPLRAVGSSVEITVDKEDVRAALIELLASALLTVQEGGVA